METAIDYLVRLWPVALGFVGLIAWLVKVDGRTSENAKEIARVEKRMGDQRKEDTERTERYLTEIRSDIKTLLQRGAD